MACPKCGGQSTEYDDKKWSCLRCGNKFVYEPTQASHTLVQSNVHIQGQATFELDVENARSPLPKMVKMIEHDPSYFGKQISDLDQKIGRHNATKFPIQIVKYCFLLLGLVLGLVGVVCLFSLLVYPPEYRSEVGDGMLAITGCWLLGIGSILLYFRYRKAIKAHNSIIQNCQQQIYSLEHDNHMETKIGDYVVCPYCENPFEYVPVNSLPPVESLKHCLNCGRQFFTSGLNSYPVRFK